jgi:predicted nucleotidyltransferase
MIVKTKQDVLKILEQHQDRLKGFGVRRFGLFGSFVKNNVNENSDVDILVLFEPEFKTFDNFMNLSLFLEDLLERKVDLITVESLSPYLGDKILREVEYVSFS